MAKVIKYEFCIGKTEAMRNYKLNRSRSQTSTELTKAFRPCAISIIKNVLYQEMFETSSYIINVIFLNIKISGMYKIDQKRIALYTF